MADVIWCPLYADGGGKCDRKKCGWWDRVNNDCAIVVISRSLNLLANTIWSRSFVIQSGSKTV